MDNFTKYLPHLLELRQRAIRCIIFFTLLLCPLLYFSSELYTQVAKPILKVLPSGNMLVATQVITPFTVPLKLALFVCFVLAIPYFLYQTWSFVAPGLYHSERRTIGPLVLASMGLFYGGVAFAHCIVCPMALNFLIHMAPKGVTVMTDIQHYLDFMLALYLSFGAAFQVPIITFLLVRTGVTSVAELKKNRPYIIVGAFVIGMLLTPPDVVSQILLAIPLLVLFESGLWLARWLAPLPRAPQREVNSVSP